MSPVSPELANAVVDGGGEALGLAQALVQFAHTYLPHLLCIVSALVGGLVGGLGGGIVCYRRRRRGPTTRASRRYADTLTRGQLPGILQGVCIGRTSRRHATLTR